jgi:mediator of RNA polymerase II transcription subunit 14
MANREQMRHIEPPSLSNEEHEQRLEELNIALFERLNLVDHDKIPWHFRDFTIDGGVATFKVKGEFEVDLTVGDEDAESQFWFIDLRFAFMPVPEEPSPRLKGLLERQVNQWLGEDGLRGCYNRLHEYVLTTKVNELRRQAYELSHTSWAKTLSLTTLDRGFAIQYWTNRQPQSTWIKRGSRGSDGPPKVPKSWIIVSVRSPRQIGGESREEATSSLAATWFRDGKEVKDATIEFDHDRLSADRLLKTVIAKHVSHILTAIHTKLRLAPRFMNRESALSLYISATEPSESYLSMELSSTENVSLRIEPSTGQFTFHPHNRPTLQGEAKLNHYSVDPAEVGARCLESIRWGYLADEVVRKGRPMGWTLAKNPHDLDQARGMCKIRREEACQAIYLQREGVDKDKGWYVMLMMSLQGDKWMAFQE